MGGGRPAAAFADSWVTFPTKIQRLIDDRRLEAMTFDDPSGRACLASGRAAYP